MQLHVDITLDKTTPIVLTPFSSGDGHYITIGGNCTLWFHSSREWQVEAQALRDALNEILEGVPLPEATTTGQDDRAQTDNDWMDKVEDELDELEEMIKAT